MSGEQSGAALRSAMTHAHVLASDVATALDVDPKTVQRWMSGRVVPHARNQWALADLLGAKAGDIWTAEESSSECSDELQAIYSHRSAVPREMWLGLFHDAKRTVDVLVYSGLFLAEDVELVRLIAQRAAAGVPVRLAVGDPESRQVARRGEEEGIGSAVPAKVRNAIALYRPLLELEGVEIRMHGTTLYNSLYRSDDDLLVNQHVYGIAAAQAPVLHVRRLEPGPSEVFATFAASFERVWGVARPLRQPAVLVSS